MVNRGALILRCKAPFVKWIEEADPTGKEMGMTVDRLNKERTVYLISDEDAENIEGWISENYETLFENELEGWNTDESSWPQTRDYKTFNEWFDVECHSLILDLVGDEIVDDEL
jgi:hypothetical protein